MKAPLCEFIRECPHPLKRVVRSNHVVGARRKTVVDFHDYVEYLERKPAGDARVLKLIAQKCMRESDKTSVILVMRWV